MKHEKAFSISKPSTDEIISENDLCSIGNINLFGNERVGVFHSSKRSLINSLSPKSEKQILFIQKNREPFDFEAFLQKLKNCDHEGE